ncbi:hypothetical protein GO491_02005 [Flavobacteriaceae bacterium Ap0902]|nr:hypothetical protein [Flavobacteriaceae bacterium Ap0902]
MKNRLILLLSLILVGFTSCNDDDRLETDDITTGPMIVGFQNSTFDFTYFEDEGVVENSLPIKLIGLGDGNLPTEDIVITYEVVADESTAIAGEEYTLATNSVTIPAGKDFAEIPINVNTGSMNPTEATNLTIKLTGASNGVIAYNKEKVLINFVGCATELQGRYRVFFGEDEVSTIANITKIAPNVYRSDYTPAFSANYWFEFSDVCGDLSIVGWQYQGGNPMSDSNTGGFPKGEVDGDTITFYNVSVSGVDWFQGVDMKFVKQ